MSSGTVGYTDTRSSNNYLGSVAKAIGTRLKQASNMASEERAYASKKAEDGGTSLEEAGIGKGYFFKRALGSRFGGDRIARTRGRLGATGPGTNPTKNYKQRFRGGFDYNVTNEIQSATVPLSSALVNERCWSGLVMSHNLLFVLVMDWVILHEVKMILQRQHISMA